MASLEPSSLSRDCTNIDRCHQEVIGALRRADIKRIRQILEPIKSTPECFQVLSKASKSGMYPLHYTLKEMSVTDENRTDRLDIVRTIIDSIDKNQRFQHFELRATMSKYTALHTAAANEEVDVVQAILEALPASERPKLIQMTDGKKKTVWQYQLKNEMREVLRSFSSSEDVESEADKRDESDDAEANGWAVVGCDDQMSISSTDNHLGEHSTMISWPQRLGEDSDNDTTQPTHVTPEQAFEQFDYVLDLVTNEGSYHMLMEMFINSQGKTILHIAAMHKRADLVKKLLTALEPSVDHYPIISHQCNQGKTALHYASFCDSVEIVNLLLQHCSVNKRWDLLKIQSRSNKSALHYACQVDSLSVVRALLHHSHENELDLVCLPDDDPPYNYAKSSELKNLLVLVKTHFWKTLYKTPTTLLFYNTFDDFSPERRRNGAEEEKDQMVQGFASFGIDTEVHCGFTEDKLTATIRGAVARGGDISAIIVVVMSHGKDGFVSDENNCDIRLQTIMDILSHISKLDNVPKVLILQSCLDIPTTSNSIRTHYDAQDPGSAPAVQASLYQGSRLPCSDFCLITSTARGRKSERGVMAKLFAKTARNETHISDLRDLYQALNRAMKKKQTPEIHHNLSRIITLKQPKQHCLMQRIKNFFHPNRQ